MIRSGNPTLNDKVFDNLVWDPSARMTLQGTVVKSAILLAIVVAAASYSWGLYDPAVPASAGTLKAYWIGGALGGLVVAMITIFKKNWSPVTAPIYAGLEGLFLGAFSVYVQSMFPDVPIVLQAVALTFGTFFALLGAYTSGLIKPTENFKLGVVAATGGIVMVYILSFVLGLFGINLPGIHSAGVVGIGFSLFVVVIAALNLVLDFDFIENASERGAPKYMEWYGAFGLLVTLIWLYVEFLRLLMKLNSRR
jgi:uncharacterized YccA/Bax inhibitor family protein